MVWLWTVLDTPFRAGLAQLTRTLSRYVLLVVMLL